MESIQSEQLVAPSHDPHGVERALIVRVPPYAVFIPLYHIWRGFRAVPLVAEDAPHGV